MWTGCPLEPRVTRVTEVSSAHKRQVLDPHSCTACLRTLGRWLNLSELGGGPEIRGGDKRRRGRGEDLLQP